MSLYDNLRASNSNYISQFVGSTVPEIQLAGNAMQKRADETVSLFDTIHEYGSSLDVWDPEIKEEALTGVRAVIDDIANDRESWYSARNRVRQLARDVIGNEALRASVQNKKAIQEEEALMQQIQASGDIPLRLNDPTTFRTRNEDGSLNRYTPNVMRLGATEIESVKKELFNDLQADAADGKLTRAELDDIEGFLQTGSWSGISSRKVKDYMEHALNRYKATPTYQKEVIKLQQEGITDPDLIEKHIENTLLSTGLERVFNRTGINYQRDPFYEPPASPTNPPGGPETSYEATDFNEVTEPVGLSIDDLKTGHTESSLEASGDIAGWRITHEKIEGYPKLSPEKRIIFEELSSELGKADAPVEEKVQAVSDYLSQGIIGWVEGEQVYRRGDIKPDGTVVSSDREVVTTREPISATNFQPLDRLKNSPRLLTTGLLRVGENGRSNREDWEKDLGYNILYRPIMEKKTGRVYMGNEEKFEDILYKRNKDGDMEMKPIKVMGQYDSKNFFADQVINPNLVDEDQWAAGISVRINNEEYIIGAGESERNSQWYQRLASVNDAYRKATKRPGLVHPIVYRGIQGQIQSMWDENGNQKFRFNLPGIRDEERQTGREIWFDEIEHAYDKVDDYLDTIYLEQLRQDQLNRQNNTQ